MVACQTAHALVGTGNELFLAVVIKLVTCHMPVGILHHQQQPTFAAATAPAGGESASDAGAASADADSAPARGKAIAQAKGCLGCHSVDGSRIIGPSWKGLYGGRTELADGSAARVDDDYLRRSIAEPNAQIVKGYPPLMPPSELTEDETEALLAYLRSLGGGDGKH